MIDRASTSWFNIVVLPLTTTTTTTVPTAPNDAHTDTTPPLLRSEDMRHLWKLETGNKKGGPTNEGSHLVHCRPVTSTLPTDPIASDPPTLLSHSGHKSCWRVGGGPAAAPSLLRALQPPRYQTATTAQDNRDLPSGRPPVLLNRATVTTIPTTWPARSRPMPVSPVLRGRLPPSSPLPLPPGVL
jgi:hypothetical protein